MINNIGNIETDTRSTENRTKIVNLCQIAYQLNILLN